MSGCEAAVVEPARRGDKAAFERLVESYQAPLFNLCFRMLREAGDAEDATQETFLQVYLHLKSYDPQRGFKNWLFSVASHFCIDRLRRRRRPAWQPWDAERLYHDAANDGAVPGSEQTVLQAEGRLEIQERLACLAPKERQVLAMHYGEDMSYAEIAAETGTSAGAVKSCLHRARGKLAATLRKRAACPAGLAVFDYPLMI